MAADGQRKVRVLYSFGPLTETSSPYTRRLVEALGDDVEARFFSWRALFSTWPDVLHVHWPDAMVKSRRRGVPTVKASLGLLFLMSRKLLGTRIVWTVHNLEPHESLSGLPRLFVKHLQDGADWRIYINESLENRVSRASTILHGPLAESSGDRTREPRDPTIMFFGMVRPYKGLEQLIAAYGQTDSTTGLLIVGQPVDPGYADAIDALSREHSGIRFVPDFMSTVDLEAQVKSSLLVALPYRSIYNSGAVLLALELGTHVLATRSESTEQLQQEFGADRISLFDSPLGVDSLENALVRAANQDVAGPDFSRRSWSAAADAHIRVYERVSRRSVSGNERQSAPPH